MANPYFQFKQFTVHHDQCAMKVGTDGVLLGAWVKLGFAKRVLDVGAGSGLISLMLAQRSKELDIHAIEIDESAAQQAQQNIQSSPFRGISCKYISLQKFADTCSVQFDLVVSNPPFFARSLKSPNEKRTLARHTDTLYIEDFFALASPLLAPQGRIGLIYPWLDKDFLLAVASQNGLYPLRITNVLPMPNVQPKRVLLEFGLHKTNLEEMDIVIELSRHTYSEDYINLTKEFYLKM